MKLNHLIMAVAVGTRGLVAFAEPLFGCPAIDSQGVCGGDGTGYLRPSPTPVIFKEPSFNMSAKHVVKKLEDAADDIKKRILKDVEVYTGFLEGLASNTAFDGSYCSSSLSRPSDVGLMTLADKVAELRDSYKRSAEKIRAEARDLADKVDDLKRLKSAKKNLSKDLEDLYDLLDKEETAIPLQSRTIAAIGALEFLVDELPDELD